MNLQMNGQLALVTGASKGIGYAIAERLLAEGARVAITGRDANTLAHAQDRLGGAERVHALQGDLSTHEGAADVIAGVGELGVLDILVNNVGFFEVRDFFETSDATWASMFELNVMSGVRLARALMPAMLARKHGRIVFIASEQSLKPNPDMAHYAMTKAANVSMARAGRVNEGNGRDCQQCLGRAHLDRGCPAVSETHRGATGCHRGSDAHAVLQ